MGEAGPPRWAMCSQMFAFSMFVMAVERARELDCRMAKGGDAGGKGI